MSRFLVSGPVLLTCAASNYDGEIVWRQNGIDISSGTSELTIDNAAGTLTVQFNGTTASYECSVSNRVGGVVSEFVTLDSTGGVIGGGRGVCVCVCVCVLSRELHWEPQLTILVFSVDDLYLISQSFSEMDNSV